MEKFNTLSDAIALAEFAHRNQRDEAGMQYVLHPKRVLAAVEAQGVPEYVKMAAVLHDVVEDTPFGLDELRLLGIPEAAVYLVDLLTRRPDVSPEEYYRNISENKYAVIIKNADIADNTQEWRLQHLPPATQTRLREKYAKATRMINV